MLFWWKNMNISFLGYLLWPTGILPKVIVRHLPSGYPCTNATSISYRLIIVRCITHGINEFIPLTILPSTHLSHAKPLMGKKKLKSNKRSVLCFILAFGYIEITRCIGHHSDSWDLKHPDNTGL